MAIDLNKGKNELMYYYSVNGATLGPFTLPQLLEKIDSDSLVYREGIDWTSAKDVEELKKFFVKIADQNTTSNPNISDTSSSISTPKTSQLFANPFSFEGRIRRLEYGISTIIFYVTYAVIMELAIDTPILGLALIPTCWFILAQGAKRCHDKGNSGWFQIIPFYFIVLIFVEGDKHKNEYGYSPK